MPHLKTPALPFSLLYLARRSPTVFLFVLYAALIPFDNILMIGTLGGTVTRYLGIAVIIMTWTELIVNRRRGVMRPPSVVWSWFAFLLLAGASALWAITPSETISSMFTIGGLFLIYLSMGLYPITERDYPCVTKAIIVGGLIAAMMSLFLYFREITYADSVRGSLILKEGKWADPNHFATSLILPLLLSLYWLTSQRGSRRTWAIASIVMISIAILLTGSRGGVIGAVVAVLLFYWRARHHIRRRTVIASLLISGVLVFSAWQIAPRQLLKRFDIQQVLERGGAGRFFIWSVGLKAFFHRPLNGYGYNNFPYAYELFSGVVPADNPSYRAYRVAHSIYLQTFVEIGIIGGLLLLFTLWKHWRLARTLARKSLLGVALESALVGILVSSATLGTLNYKYFWLGLTLILLLKNTMRRHRDHIQKNENS